MPVMSILLVEDKPSDVRIIIEAFKQTNIQNNLSVIGNGEDAISFLMRTGNYRDAPKPDIILLDLKIPKRNGIEVLQEIKKNSSLNSIPVIILSNSDLEVDIAKAYKYQANCYLTKPLKMIDFIEQVKFIEKFWLNYVKLPR
jgi:chemotaxis family two-component system response regulator Rcp1